MNPAIDPNEVFRPAGMDQAGALVSHPRSRREAPQIIPRGYHSAIVFTDGEAQALTGLMARHPAILSQSRIDLDHLSKVGQRLCLVVSQLIMGTFQAAYNWGAAWVGSSSPSGEFIMPEVPRDFDGLVSLLDTTLTRLEDLLPEGYPYPPMRSGRRQKVSLVDFLVTTPPNSGAYSPFLALLWKRDKALPPREQIEAIRQQVPSKVRDVAARILESARTRQPARWGTPQELLFWKGAREAYQWWYNRAADIIEALPDARLVLGSGSLFFRHIEDYAVAGGFVPFGFICPTSMAWGDFMAWLSRDRGLSVPRRFWK